MHWFEEKMKINWIRLRLLRCTYTQFKYSNFPFLPVTSLCNFTLSNMLIDVAFLVVVFQKEFAFITNVKPFPPLFSKESLSTSFFSVSIQVSKTSFLFSHHLFHHLLVYISLFSDF